MGELDKEELELRTKILAVLKNAQKGIHDAFSDLGFDESYFDLSIDLRVKVDDTELRVRERYAADLE